MLEWITAADAENMLGKDLKCYLKEMVVSPIMGILIIIVSFIFNKAYLKTAITLFIAWTLAPFVAYFISKTPESKEIVIKTNEKNILNDIAKRTWSFFNTYMNKENNYLPPDNYQENKKNLVTRNTSSTNIGLRIISNN